MTTRTKADVFASLDAYYGERFDLNVHPELLKAKDNFVALYDTQSYSRASFLMTCAKHCNERTLGAIENFLDPAIYAGFPKRTETAVDNLQVFKVEEVTLDGKPALRICYSVYVSDTKIEIIDERSLFLHVVFGDPKLVHIVNPQHHVMYKYVPDRTERPGTTMTAEEFDEYQKVKLPTLITPAQYAYLEKCIETIKIQEALICSDRTGYIAYCVWEYESSLRFCLCKTPSEPVLTLYFYDPT